MVIRKKSRSHLKPVRRRDRNGHMRTVYIKKSSSKKTRFGNIPTKNDCVIHEGRDDDGRIYAYVGQCIEKMVGRKLQNIKHGEGMFGFRDGDATIMLYSGHWENGKKHGKGTDYRNGQKWYEGKFKDGEWNGKGTLYNDDGTIKWKGKFKDGEKVLPDL